VNAENASRRASALSRSRQMKCYGRSVSEPLLLIYGATGFTGRLIVQEALAFGLRCVIGGRSRDNLEALSRSRGIPFRVASLDDQPAVAAMLEDVKVVVNAAGPFRLTALPLARACIEHGVHYLDIGGEYDVIDSLATLGDRARQRNVMLLPAAGFDVVPSDCLAALLSRRLPDATRLSIALRGLNAISRGSAASVFSQSAERVMVRRNGRLIGISPGELTGTFDFGTGPTPTTAVSWADISSAYYTTKIPEITVYYEATPLVRLGLALNRYGSWWLRTPGARWWQSMGVGLLPEGPSLDQRASGSADVVARVENSAGHCVEARLHTPEVYSFTASTSVALADRILSGRCVAGFQTPAMAYGAEYALTLPGVSYIDVPPHTNR
jgi:short subunit dehydrogenase-like uncharacterized protein